MNTRSDSLPSTPMQAAASPSTQKTLLRLLGLAIEDGPLDRLAKRLIPIEVHARGHLAGAALDVFVTEPLPAEHPLWDLQNVIVTPHIAGATPLADDRAAAIFVDNLGRYLRGEPLRNEVFR